MKPIYAENCNALLSTCIASCVELTNTAFSAFSEETRRHVNALVFAGARVVVTIEMTPNPGLRGTLEANGETLELFRVLQSPEIHTETSH